MESSNEPTEKRRGRPPVGDAEKRKDRITARITERERETAELLKKRFNLPDDSSVVTFLLKALQGKSTQDLAQFLVRDDVDESLRLLAA